MTTVASDELCRIASKKPNHRPECDNENYAEARGKRPATRFSTAKDRQAQGLEQDKRQVQGGAAETGNGFEKREKDQGKNHGNMTNGEQDEQTMGKPHVRGLT